MRRNHALSRRRFLTVAGAALAAPHFVPASALGRNGATAPSERIHIGCIGTGGRGQGNIQVFLGCPGTRINAVCDVDAKHRQAAREMVDAFYRDHPAVGVAGKCDEHRDFREILARPDVDAVMIATPDHWHAPISILAAEAGKDIYCEKPMSTTVAEGRAVAETMRRLGRVYQSGTQRRSIGHFRLACEAVRNGRIGKLKTIVEYLQPGPACEPQPVQPVPEGFDYDMWLGPAPWAPYTERRCHGSFRFILDYSDGKISDQGAHFIDIGQWANNTEDTGPVEFEGTGVFPEDGLFDTPVTYNVRCRYANGVEMVLTHETMPNGDWAVRFVGTDGWILVQRDSLEASRPELIEPLHGGEVPLRKSDHHWQDFLDAARTRAQPIAPAHIVHRSHSICHLAVICLRLGRKIRWDPEQERAIDDEAANRMLCRPKREPWSF
jgi:predicted dehydrogenase